MTKLMKTIATIAAAFLAGAIGSFFIDSSAGSWYDMLAKPPLTPPTYLFGIVWTVLYAVVGIAGAMVWTLKQNAHTESWMRFYFTQLLFNTGWIIFFFGYHAIILAFFDLFVLLFMAVTLTISAYALDKRITYLLVPYCLWLVFAGYLNAGIWYLN